MANSNTGKDSANKTARKQNRPSHIVAAERINRLGFDATDAFVEHLVGNHPVAAQYIHERLSARLAS